MEWDYAWFESNEIREARCAQILEDLAQGRLSFIVHAKDSRPVHFQMFEGMTNPGDECFAGHYRGEAFAQLVGYRCYVPMDPRVGVEPALVATELDRFAGHVDLALDAVSRIQTDKSREELVVRTIGIACALLVEFLRIHPYANGNGHIARFIVWALLAHIGVWPRSWPLNESLPHPYGTLISMFRDGNRVPLIRFVLERL